MNLFQHTFNFLLGGVREKVKGNLPLVDLFSNLDDATYWLMIKEPQPKLKLWIWRKQRAAYYRELDIVEDEWKL